MRQETCYYNLKKKFQRRRRRKKKKTRCTAIAVSTCRVRGGQREVPGGTFFFFFFYFFDNWSRINPHCFSLPLFFYLASSTLQGFSKCISNNWVKSLADSQHSRFVPGERSALKKQTKTIFACLVCFCARVFVQSHGNLIHFGLICRRFFHTKNKTCMSVNVCVLKVFPWICVLERNSFCVSIFFGLPLDV